MWDRIDRSYLEMNYLIGLLVRKAKSFCWYEGQELTEPVTYLGLVAPDDLPSPSKIVTLSNLKTLIPE